MPKIKFLKPKEAEAFLSHVRNTASKADILLVELYLLHGLRLAEAVGRQFEYWVDLTGRRIPSGELATISKADRRIRRSDIPGLMIEDFDLEAREMQVIGKGNRVRVVPLLDCTTLVFREHVGEERYGRLFQGSYSASSVQNRIAEYGRKAGLFRTQDGSFTDAVHPHMLRHTFAISALRNGVTIRDLQVFLGHSNLSTTEVYLDFAPDDAHSSFREAAARGGLS